MAVDLYGYDMVLQITQNEINSQFSHLLSSGYISPMLKTNSVSQSGGSFGGGEWTLSTYLRGYMAPPTVTLAEAGSPTTCLFQFTMQKQTMTQAIMEAAGITQSQVDSAFASPQSGPDGSEYGLLVNYESVTYTQGGVTSTLTDQTVYYWLQKTTTTIGTTTTSTYYLIPALFYTDGAPTLVDLEGLPIQFEVDLAMIPTTPAAISAAVAAGIMPPEVSTTITDNSFDSQYFSLQQLFLNFDTTNFAQWSTPVPPSTTIVTGASVDTVNNTFSVSTEPLSELNSSGTWLSSISIALQLAFGVTGDNPAATPYLIGISATSTSPANSNSQSPPILVPTSVGFSSLLNSTDAGLSVLNYQVMGGGGTNPTSPAPNVATNYVTTNDYSGELLFSEASFFTPQVYNPLVAALKGEHAPAPDWVQDGSTFIYQTSYTWTVSSTPPPSGWSGVFGSSQTVTQTENPSYKIVVDGSAVTASGTLSITQNLTTTLVVLYIPINIAWSMTCSSTFTQTLTMEVKDNDELDVVRTVNQFSEPTNGPLVPNNWEAGLSSFIIGIVDSIISILFPISLLTTLLNPQSWMSNNVKTSIDSSIDSLATQLNSNLTASTTSNFISPTGSVFFLNNPRFNTDFDLQMDVTYVD